MTHLDLYASAIPHTHLRCLSGRDHQLNDDLSEVAQDIGRVSKRVKANAGHNAPVHRGGLQQTQAPFGARLSQPAAVRTQHIRQTGKSAT